MIKLDGDEKKPPTRKREGGWAKDAVKTLKSLYISLIEQKQKGI